MCLQEVAGVEVGGEVGCDELFVLSARLAVTASVRVGQRSTIPDYHSAFAPATIPVTGDVSHPVALSPNTRPNADFGVQLHAHLEIALENRFGDGE